jgi:16S rRNA processing protein RimM
MKKGRSDQRPASFLSLAGQGRGGGANVNGSKGALTPPPSPPAHEGREKRTTSLPDNLVLVGEFGRAHSLKGEVRLKSYTADPAAIADYDPLIAASGQRVSLTNVRQAPGGAPDILIARVAGVTSRDGAEALNRVRLYVERDKLPPPNDDDEFLLADLIGLPVEDEAGKPIGTVVDVPNYGGGDLLEIAPVLRGPTAFLPFTRAFVPVVDVAARRIVVAPPEDFFEPAKPEPSPEDAA